MNGYNVTFFAHGQTGSGKTYSLIAPGFSLNAKGGVDESGGVLPHYGLLPRTALYIFNKLQESGSKFVLTATVI